MAIDPLENLAVALRNQQSRELNDATSIGHCVLGAMLAMDKYWKQPKLRVRMDVGFHGDEVQEDFKVGDVATEGVSARTGSLASAEMADQENFTWKGAKFKYSGYQQLETIRKTRLNALAKSPPALKDYVKRVSESRVESLMTKLDTHLFPATAVAAASYGTAPNTTEESVMAFAYGLQNPGSSYEYGTLDLNNAAYAGIRAIVNTNAATPTPSNLRTRFLIELKHKKAKVDMGVCGTAAYDFMQQQAENKVVVVQAKEMEFGGEWINYCGIWWLSDLRMDLLSTKELYVGDSSTLRLQIQNMNDVQHIRNVPRKPSIENIQWFSEVVFYNANPRKWGRWVGVNAS